MSFDTDYIPVTEREVVEEIETIMTESTKVNLSAPQRIASRDVEQWQAFQRGLRWNRWSKRFSVVLIVLVVIVCAYVAYRIGR